MLVMLTSVLSWVTPVAWVKSILLLILKFPLRVVKPEVLTVNKLGGILFPNVPKST